MKPTLTEEERKQRLADAKQTVERYAFGSALAGVVPIPLVDLAVLTAVQLKMVAALAKIFETEFVESVAKAIISSLVGSAAAAAVVTPVASIVKIIPGIGTLAGAVTVGGLASTATYAIGKIFIEHLDSGETILTLDPEKVRDHYVEQVRNATKSGTSKPSPCKP